MKLTTAEVLAIRQSDKTNTALAAEYGVSKPYVGQVRRGLVRNPDEMPIRPPRKRGRPRKPAQPCACGCGELANPKAKYITGHCQANRFSSQYQPFRTQPLTDEEFISESLSNCESQDLGYKTPCLIWQGGRNRTSGYPTCNRLKDGKKCTTTRHREIYAILHPEFDSTQRSKVHIHHVCGNGRKGCLRPDHLEAYPAGKHSQAHQRITRADVDDMKRLRKEGWTNRQIAERYGYKNKGSISHIITGRRWADAS